MIEWLEIRPGGVLVRIAWKFDKAADKGGYVEEDVTDFAFKFLFEECHLHPDVTLRDVFALLQRHADLFSLILDSRLPVLLAEAEKPMPQREETEVEWLELYWILNTEEVYEDMRTPGDRLRPTGKKGISGGIFPGFHGKGFEVDGDRTNYGIGFTPANELMPLPLRLSQDFMLFDEHEWMKCFSDDAEEAATERPKKPEAYQTTFEGCVYSLGHILYGILWEMLWHGTPEERDERKDELVRRVKEVRDGYVEEENDV